jgi:hypothetical protein
MLWHLPASQIVLTIYTQQSLDDVDFTVLAATSVLGDLIDKCPPAEACRDAFDRMSKATIQMCMSTTGFGPQALRPPHYGGPSQPPSTTHPPASDADTDMTGYQSTGYFQQMRRPTPRFDMNLKELFSEDETDRRSFGRISNQLGSMRPPPPPPPVKQEHQQMQPFTTDLKISPQMRSHHQQQQETYSFSRQDLPSPQHQQPYTPTSTATTISPLMSHTPTNPNAMASPYQLTTQLPYNAFAQNITSTYPDLGTFNDLEFLDSFPVPGASSNANVTDAAGPLQDLGFGMGFGDGTHDWSDGNGLDLFDGFFFGGGPGTG